MQMTFDQLVEELQHRTADELGELSQLTHKYAIEQRRAEILQNAEQASQDWENGKLKAFDNVEELMKSIDEA